MRIVNREEFLALPGQVLYAKVHKGSPQEGLCIKYPAGEGHSGNGWCYDGLDPCAAMECGGSDELWDNIHHMERDPTLSKPTDFHYTCRTVCFDGPEVQFMIYEKDDIVKLKGRIDELLENTIEPDQRTDSQP